jgi:hypothetical protein
VTRDAVRRVVGRERVGFAVEREATVRDAIADAADDRAEIRRRAHVVLYGVVAEHDIVEPPRAIRHEQPHDDRAVIGDVRAEALRVSERVERRRAAIRQFAEGRGVDAGGRAARAHAEFFGP